jgi:hypothetical protein
MTIKQAKLIQPGTLVIITKKSKDWYNDFTIGKMYIVSKYFQSGSNDNSSCTHWFQFAKADSGCTNSWPCKDCELVTELAQVLYG